MNPVNKTCEKFDLLQDFRHRNSKLIFRVWGNSKIKWIALLECNDYAVMKHLRIIIVECSNTTPNLKKKNPVISSNLFTQSAAKDRSISLDLRVAVQ